MEQIKIALCVSALCGLVLWFYYSKIKNTHIRDDQLPERGCCLFSFLILAVADFLEMLQDFSFWSVAGLIICISIMRIEIFSKIPRATRIEEAKKNNEPLYTSCGLKRMPPNYNINWHS